MPSAEDFLTAARSELGYMENPSGSNLTKFADEAHQPNGYAWCATFTIAIANRVGLQVPPAVHETAYTPSALNGWQQSGRRWGLPRVGDWAYFNFHGGTGPEHVGVVESFDINTVTTIDGNTIPDGQSGDQANGGEVCRKTRSRDLVVGYGRPDYTTPSIGDLFMDLGPRATARILHQLAWHHEPTVADLDAAHFLLGTATTDEQKDAVVASIFDKESK